MKLISALLLVTAPMLLAFGSKSGFESLRIQMEQCNLALKTSDPGPQLTEIVSRCLEKEAGPFAIQVTAESVNEKFNVTLLKNFDLFLDKTTQECILTNLEKTKVLLPNLYTPPSFPILAAELEISKRSPKHKMEAVHTAFCGQKPDELRRENTEPDRDSFVKVGSPIEGDKTYKSLEACRNLLPKSSPPSALLGELSVSYVPAGNTVNVPKVEVRMTEAPNQYVECLSKALKVRRADVMPFNPKITIDGEEGQPGPFTTQEWFYRQVKNGKTRYYSWRKLKQ